jgi:hypothetical protein
VEVSRTNRPFDVQPGAGSRLVLYVYRGQEGDCSAGDVDSRVTLDISKYYRSTRLESFMRLSILQI